MAQDISEVRGHVEILRWVKGEQAKLKEIETNAKAAIEEALGHADEGEVDGAVVVRRKEIKSNRLDQALLRSTVGDAVVESCKVVSVSHRFEVVQ